jgi:hypothetical protein
MIQMKKIRKNITYLILFALGSLILAQNHYLVCTEYNGKINLETYSDNCCISYKSNSVSENLNTESSQNCFEQSIDFCTDTEYSTSIYYKEFSFNGLIKKIALCCVTWGLLPTDNFASAPFDYISGLISPQSSSISLTVLRI